MRATTAARGDWSRESIFTARLFSGTGLWRRPVFWNEIGVGESAKQFRARGTPRRNEAHGQPTKSYDSENRWKHCSPWKTGCSLEENLLVPMEKLQEKLFLIPLSPDIKKFSQTPPTQV